MVALLNASATARAAEVEVVLTPPFSPEKFAKRGAVGLLVAGKGSTASREETLALLELDRLPPMRCLERRPCPLEIFVSLPPREEQHNVRRYQIAVVGGSYHGLLVDERTRLPGLVFVGDVPDTVRALARGGRAPVRWRASPDAPAQLERLDARLTEAHDARGAANVFLAVAMLVTALLGLGSSAFGRVAILVAPAALVAAFTLSALDATSTVVLAVVALALAFFFAPFPTGPVLVAFFASYLALLTVWPETNSLATIGPHPDGGGRFYGVTNQVETLLVGPALVAAAAVRPAAFAPVALLALATVGWSEAGADGGGIVVLAAGFLLLAVRLYRRALTPWRVGLAVAAVALLVGLDAAFGAQSHVSDALRGGPGELAGDLAHRLRVSYDGVTSSWGAALAFAVGIAGLAFMATRRPRLPVLDATLIAIGASLLVNDTPTDVAFFGALGAATVWAWERGRLDSPAMRRAAVAIGILALAAGLAGCGGGKETSPTAQTVQGTLPKAEGTGKGLFEEQGCGNCHTYEPASSNGTVGPDLDKLPEYANTAGKPLDEFVHESIVDPNAYVEKGFPKGVMPPYDKLSDEDVNALVEFLTPQS